jgi:hypothetical protein
MHWFAGRWRHWPHWGDVFKLGYDSAVQLGDIGRQAAFLNRIARTYTVLGQDPQPALAYAEQALALARLAGDVGQEASAWQNIARARTMLGDLRGALDAVGTAAERFELAGDIDEVCQTLVGR